MKKEMKVKLVKVVICTAAGIAAAAVVSACIKSAIPSTDSLTKVEKLIVGFGSAILISICADVASDYVAGQIDEAIQINDLIIEKINERLSA